MHSECFEFVKQFATLEQIKIVEIGSRDINGSVRALFPRATFTGLDLSPGRGVDIVIDATRWIPPEPVDCVICCEVLEHASNWREIIDTAAAWLKTGGRIILTCAGPGRAEHSAIDGGALRPGEYYLNLTDSMIAEQLMSSGFEAIDCEQRGNDIQATAVMATFEPRQKRRAEIAEQYRYE